MYHKHNNYFLQNLKQPNNIYDIKITFIIKICEIIYNFLTPYLFYKYELLIV